MLYEVITRALRHGRGRDQRAFQHQRGRGREGGRDARHPGAGHREDRVAGPVV